MPYISSDAKADLKHRQPNNVGELTYVFTKLALHGSYYMETYNNLAYAARQYMSFETPKFAKYAEVLGAFAAAKLEIVRRNAGGFGRTADARWALETAMHDFYMAEVGPYEDTKIIANGDVEELARLPKPTSQQGT